jgi:photosystem II stability/assembly factor-like uncharacterized protein
MYRPFALLFGSFLSLAAGTAAAQNWRWLSPKPQGVSVNAITVVGGQEWLVGDFGTISTTSDGAQTFGPQTSGTFANLNAVFFFDANHGWAVGDSGTIVATSDGGQHWTAQVSQSSRKLRGVYFTSQLKGFVVGDYRTLLETTDGGKTWAGLGSAVLSLDGITFTDPQHGFICGDTGSILLTTDGGATFNLVQTGTTAHLLSIAFADANHGFAVGLGGAVVTTSDGGHSWSAQVIGPDDLASLVVLSPTQAYAIATDGVLYKTEDGASWSVAAALAGTGAFNVIAVEQDDSLDAACSTGQWFHSPPLSAADGGLVFKDVNDLFSPGTNIAGVAFGSLDAGVMVDEFGFLYNTQDRGQHIQLVGPPDAGSSVSWYAVSMPTPTDAFAVGTQASFAVSHDSGRTWAFVPVPLATELVQDLTAVQFLDAQRGFLGASPSANNAEGGGVIYVTANGGAAWQSYGSGLSSSAAAHAMAFTDLQHGAIVGDFGEVGWTTDGQTFSPSFAIGDDLRAVACPATGLLITAGDFGALAHSLDQGANFYSLVPPTNASLNAMVFFDHQNGVFGGGLSSGSIYGSHDGAQSFETQFTGATSILGMSFVDRLHGYAVGGGGALLVTDTGGEPACATAADCADGGNYGVECLSGVCQQCTEDSRCGPTCAACPANSPVCYGAYCGSCVNDLDCPEDGGYCVLGVCQVPRTFDLDGGPDAGDGGEEPDAGDGGGNGTGTTTGGGAGTTGAPSTASTTGTTGGAPATCATDPSLCKSSGCGCTQGGGAEAVLATALALAFCWPRRRRG